MMDSRKIEGLIRLMVTCFVVMGFAVCLIAAILVEHWVGVLMIGAFSCLALYALWRATNELFEEDDDVEEG